MFRNFLILALVSFFFSCSEKKVETQELSKEINSILALNYAKGFKISYLDETKKIEIFHPTKGDLIQTIYISDTSIIKPQPDNLFAFSVTHLAFLNALKLSDKVKGFANYNYIFDTLSYPKLNLVDFAISDQLDVEKVVSHRPDLLFVSGSLGESPQMEKIKRSGIPVINVVEWIEVHPLARAEWLKFFAAFYNLESKADSIFSEIEANYMATKKLVNSVSVEKKPKVLTGKNYKGTWYMPGAQNFSSILMKDAGGNYPVEADKSSSESIPYSFETVVKKFSDADVWLRPGASSLQNLLDEDKRYAYFLPVKNLRVYDVKKRMLPNGANDYWETALVRPDILLKDLSKIFHPQILPNHELYFYEALE